VAPTVIAAGKTPVKQLTGLSFPCDIGEAPPKAPAISFID